MDKKGAVELSMTTIIIIVIGITILSLGLVWIRSVFTDVGELSSGAFEQGQTQINEIFGKSKEAVALSPSETTIEQGATKTVTLAIRNSGSEDISGVYAEVTALKFGGEEATDLACGFDDTGTPKTNTYSLSSGESTSRGLIVKDSGSAVGTYICAVTIYGLPGGDKTTSLVVNIE
jgi:hypothetical protein